MNTLLAWFNSPEWMIVVKTLLHTLWQAGGLALLLWIALRRVATPSSRYRLTLGTLATILGATLLTWALLNQSTPKPTASDYPQETIPAYKPSTTSPTASFREPSVIAYATPIAKPAQETRWSGWLALAWLLGTALMLTRAGIQVAGAERLRRSCKPLDDSRITQLLAEAQRALNLTRRIRVAVTEKLTSPAVAGVIVPTLILPLTLLTTLTPEQIRFILLHELAHIRRGDYFANLFQLFIEALLFFNPAVWWISHQVRREREACCDALAIELSGAPVDYAWTLLHVAETVLNPPPDAAPAFSENQNEPSSLTDRVQRLLVPGYRPALRLTWRAMLAAIVVGGTLLLLSAVGARNVVGAVSTNSSEKATKPATNVVEKVSGVEIQNLRSDSQILYDLEKKTTIASNGSVVKITGFKVSADRVDIHHKTGELIAEGKARIEATNITFTGEKLSLNLKTKQITGSNYSITLPPQDLKPTAATNDGGQPIHLVTRTFQADPNMMAQALGIIPKVIGSAGLHITNLYLTEFFHAATNATQIGQAISNKFKAIGVDLDPDLGETYFYTDQSGSLFVRATKKELDLIEDYIKKNTTPTPQVNIKIRWVEIPQKLMTPAWLNAASNAFLLPLSDSKTHSSILTKQEMADLIQRIERPDGMDLLNEAQVTTLSERPAQISISDARTVVTGINPKALTKPGVISTNTDASAYLETQSATLGPVFDVLPTLSADRATISLHMINTHVEFLGYNKAAKEIPIYVNGKKSKTTLPLPRYRVCQMTNDAVVPNGRTLILGNFPMTEIAKQTNGETLTTDVTSTQTNLLFVLITPTIIDPASNRAKPATILYR